MASFETSATHVWHSSRAFISRLIAGVFILAMMGTMQLASADLGPGDDRLLTTPTQWWTYYNIDANTVTARITEHSARITDLRINSASPLRFTVTMVRNIGIYATGWSWYPGLTGEQVGVRINADHGRLISAQRYDTAAGPRYAVVMVDNTGSNARAWWWYDSTSTELGTALSKNQARLIHLSAYGPSVSRRYVAIMVPNVGSDAYAWGWWVGVSAQALSKNLNAGDHLIDLDANVDGTFNAIAYHAPGGAAASWFFGASASELIDIALQHGTRITSLSPNGSKYAGVMVDDMSGLPAKLRDAYEGKITSGAYGFMLAREDGAVLAELQSSKKFEPASVIKILFHLHALRKRQAGIVNDATSVTYRWSTTPDINVENPGCPSDFPNVATTNVKTADELMMMPSNNQMTFAITDSFGGTDQILSDTGAAVGGLPDTTMIKCGGIGDRQTTLRDLGRIWMGAYGPKALLNSEHQRLFHDRMNNESNWGNADYPYRNYLCRSGGIAEQEAHKLGKTAAVIAKFCAAMRFMVKGGSLGTGGKIVWTMESLTGVPVTSGGKLTRIYYRYGAYVDGMTGGDPELEKCHTVGWGNYEEGMRQAIHNALETW